MNKITHIILIAGILFSSCADFLEPKSQSEFTPDDVEALSAMLLGAGYPSPKGISYLTAALRILEDDITTAPPTDGLMNGYPPYVYESYKKVFGLFTWQPDYDYSIGERSSTDLQSINLYENHYKYISVSNLVFDYIDKVSGSQYNKDQLMAEAHTLRAYFYFQLANIYGAPYATDKKALAVPLKLTGYLSIDPLSRNTVEEVYNQILSDLHKAEELFENMDARFAPDFRVNIWVTRQLLSRVYLYMEEWNKATEYAKKVMDNTEGIRLIDLNTKPVPPSSGYQKFIYTSYANPEAMWIFDGVGDFTRFAPTFVNLEFPDIADPVNLPGFVASESLLSSFDSNDLRLQEYITVYDSGAKGKFNTTFSKTAINLNGFSPNSSYHYGQSFRIAEAYLNYAEAEAWRLKTGKGGKAQNVLDVLNTLRLNRFSDYQALTVTDADQLIDITREERRRELCFEAHRWFDLRRYGMPEIKHIWVDETGVKTYTLTQGDRSYTLAIPYPVVEANKLIVQNPLAPPRNN